jgi:hypothetical protein
LVIATVRIHEFLLRLHLRDIGPAGVQRIGDTMKSRLDRLFVIGESSSRPLPYRDWRWFVAPM